VRPGCGWARRGKGAPPTGGPLEGGDVRGPNVPNLDVAFPADEQVVTPQTDSAVRIRWGLGCNKNQTPEVRFKKQLFLFFFNPFAGTNDTYQ